MKDIFFSVVIPVHNKEKWVGRSIESVLAQTFNRFELIIVDDASVDASRDVIESYNDSRIQQFKRSNPGPGGYAARNYGVSRATANWIVFLDADDVMQPNHLEVFFENIMSMPSCDPVFINNFLKIINGHAIARTPDLNDGVVSRAECLLQMTKYDFIIMNNICINRGFFLRLGGFPEGRYKSGGDVYFWLKLVLRSSFIYFDCRVTSVWLTEGSEITNSISNFSGKEPVLDINKELIDGLKFTERRLFYKVVNRKVVNRMVTKKINSAPFYKDLMDVHWISLPVSYVGKILMLLMPNSLFRLVYRRFVK